MVRSDSVLLVAYGYVGQSITRRVLLDARYDRLLVSKGLNLASDFRDERRPFRRLSRYRAVACRHSTVANGFDFALRDLRD